MSSVEKFKAFAEEAIPAIAQAFRDHDFEGNSRYFDPELPDEFTKEDFEEAISYQEDDLGYLESHKYLGYVKGPQDRHPGCIRFVYSGVFTKAEGLIILCVHERDGKLYLNEHVYYWD